jgi:hypothetical protein
MKTITALLCLFALAGCATEQSIAYEKARYEANPSYADESNQSGTPLTYIPKDRDYSDYFSCLARFNQRFNSDDSRFICQ